MSELPRTRDQKHVVFSEIQQVRDLSGHEPNPFDLQPSIAACHEIAQQMGLLGLRKLRFVGDLRPEGKTDWRLRGKLGASVQQACVITSDPVNTRIDVPVSRLYLRDFNTGSTADIVEFDGEDDRETLESVIDLGAVLVEALALALPDYPRVAGAELPETVFGPPGNSPMRDADAKPFAALAALRDKLDD